MIKKSRRDEEDDNRGKERNRSRMTKKQEG
jgi:hypothetical protein